MSDFTPNQEEIREEEQPSYTPASFEKRTAAWIGIAYVVMMLFIVTFSIYTGGGTLSGTFPLFLIPAAVGVLILAAHRQRKGTAPGGLPVTVIIMLLCMVAVVIGLMLGIPPLLAALRNPF